MAIKTIILHIIICSWLFSFSSHWHLAFCVLCVFVCLLVQAVTSGGGFVGFGRDWVIQNSQQMPCRSVTSARTMWYHEVTEEMTSTAALGHMRSHLAHTNGWQRAKPAQHASHQHHCQLSFKYNGHILSPSRHQMWRADVSILVGRRPAYKGEGQGSGHQCSQWHSGSECPYGWPWSVDLDYSHKVMYTSAHSWHSYYATVISW